jgi:hypothetical protein
MKASDFLFLDSFLSIDSMSCDYGCARIVKDRSNHRYNIGVHFFKTYSYVTVNKYRTCFKL